MMQAALTRRRMLQALNDTSVPPEVAVMRALSAVAWNFDEWEVSKLAWAARDALERIIQGKATPR